MTLVLVIVLAASPDPSGVGPRADSVNAVLGDASWVARHGALPGPRVASHDRIRVHLEHVETMLRARPTDALAPEQRVARARHLDRLRAYRLAGAFPRNDVVPGRRTRFLDPYGNACAVGDLMIHSGSRALAERIAREHEWAYLGDIPVDAELARWITASGLTREELAMIQPGYGFERPPPLPIEEPRPRGPIRKADRQRARALLQNAGQHVRQCLAQAPVRVPRLRVVAVWIESGRLARVEMPALDPQTSACVRVAIIRQAGRIPPFRGQPFRLAFHYARS